jgi:predicted permease
MSALLDIILPVFVVIGFGYLAVWRGYLTEAATDNLMYFAQTFAIPCLLFRAISTLDLGPTFTWPLLISFYSSVVLCFLAGLLGARLVFHRPWEDSVAIGVCAMFSNTVLLGLPITERAFGADALETNYALIAIHAPFCYIIGITVMECVRNGSGSRADLPAKVARGVFGNAIIIGLALGFVVNLTGVSLPTFLSDGVDLLARAALPAALFGLGGILVRYRPEGDMRVIAMVVLISLVVQPALVWVFGSAAGLGTEAFRSALITGAMAPGVNVYILANMYGVAKRVAASSVLFATAMSVLTTWGWLAVVP